MSRRVVSILLCGDVPTQKLKINFPSDLSSLEAIVSRECNVQLFKLEILDDEFDTYVMLRDVNDIKGDRVQLYVRCEQQQQQQQQQYQPPSRQHNTIVSINCNCGRGEKIQFHCQEDGSFVCALCAVMGSYRSRQLQTLSEAAGTFLNSIPEMEGKIESEIAHVNRLLLHLSVFESRRNSEDHIKTMHDTCDALVKIINKKRSEMDERMRHLQREDPSHIQAERAVLSSKHEELRSIQSQLHGVMSDASKEDHLRVISTVSDAQSKLPLFLNIEPASLPHRIPQFNAALQASVLNEISLTMAEDTILYPPPNTYRYKIIGGGSYAFDVSTMACSEFGLYFMQRIRVRREGGVHLNGTILGVLSCALWWVSDDNTCASPLVDVGTPLNTNDIIIIGHSSPTHYPEELEIADLTQQLHHQDTYQTGRYRRQ